MLKNYLKVAFRHIRKDRVSSVVNIVGLAIGMSAAVLIYLWVANERSYDRFYTHAPQLYKLWNRTAATNGGAINCWPAMAPPVGPALQQQFPEVTATARYDGPTETALTRNDKAFVIHLAAVDSSFLTMFSFPLQEGNAPNILHEDNDLVLTQSLAKVIFGAEDPIGKLVRLNNKETYKVTGILKDLPGNTEFNFDCLIPLHVSTVSDAAAWSDHQYMTYVELKSGTSAAAFNQKIKNLVLTHAPLTQLEIFIQPSNQWHLYPEFKNGVPSGGAVRSTQLMSVIACLIVLIACFNFMNLATAQSEKRSKEVGIRKVIGAGQSSLIGQFLCESMLMAFMAGILAVLTVRLTLPLFNNWVGKRLTIDYGHPSLWEFAIAFVGGIGLIAGTYPAFYLSSFRPIRVLKSLVKDRVASVTPRKFLVVLQFIVAIILITATLIMYLQIRYVQRRDNGYNRANLVECRIKGDIGKNYTLIKNELLSTGAAISVCQTGLPITMDNGSDNGFQWGNMEPGQKNIQFSEFATAGNFVSTMGIDLVAGRDIDISRYPMDSASVLINETALVTMGLKMAIGQTIKGGRQSYTIVGVIKDFINGSPAQRTDPMIVFGSNTWRNNVAFRLNGHYPIATAMMKAETIFKKYNPGYPFDYSFADDDYRRKTGDETKATQLAGIFAGLTIFISCLGLFGLAAFMAGNRSKEIGIRKVLGASATKMIALLTKEFAGLVTLAFCISVPVSGWAMHRWLEDFTYRIDLHWWMFLLGGLLAMVIALFAVSFHALKAALVNPIKSLKTE